MKMQSNVLARGCLVAAVLFLVISTGLAQTNDSSRSRNSHFDAGKLNPNAPPETAQFGQLVGIWDAEQIVRQRDGAWSKDTTRAEWHWYYILDGHAIQDDWISPSLNIQAEGKRSFGTNIRIYDPKEKQWVMAWIDNTNRKLLTFTATFEDGKIIMRGYDNFGRLSRIIFQNISERSFDWVKEWTQDESKTWFEVARIHCTRRR